MSGTKAAVRRRDVLMAARRDATPRAVEVPCPALSSEDRRRLPEDAIVRVPSSERITAHTLRRHGWTSYMIRMMGKPTRGPDGVRNVYEPIRVASYASRAFFQDVLAQHYQEQLNAPSLVRAKRPVPKRTPRPAPPPPDLLSGVMVSRAEKVRAAPVLQPRAADGPVVDSRSCPVCGKGGVPVGRYRHQRCDGLRGRGENAVEAPAVAVGSVEYRRLVAAVEEREARTRGRRSGAGGSRPVRIPAAREAVLLRCGGRCENPDCGGQPADVKDDGTPILEVDHLEEIAAGGRDHPEQMVALCPNCHVVKTHGRTREALRSLLAEVAAHAHARWNREVALS
ncbi:HNH endonuclease signature motif containing protein [Streptomyces yerevanensis]|uniref:HNH endonuclease signature motif containing protein n=1 Tax=Streptomyces yerevanensis TaxID=66378 RepID=UPI00052631C3|nr:HNH endonuclease signature motif containing protein [Streptomyces yerevanensis]